MDGSSNFIPKSGSRLSVSSRMYPTCLASSTKVNDVNKLGLNSCNGKVYHKMISRENLRKGAMDFKEKEGFAQAKLYSENKHQGILSSSLPSAIRDGKHSTSNKTQNYTSIFKTREPSHSIEKANPGHQWKNAEYKTLDTAGKKELQSALETFDSSKSKGAASSAYAIEEDSGDTIAHISTWKNAASTSTSTSTLTSTSKRQSSNPTMLGQQENKKIEYNHSSLGSSIKHPKLQEGDVNYQLLSHSKTESSVLNSGEKSNTDDIGTTYEIQKLPQNAMSATAAYGAWRLANKGSFDATQSRTVLAMPTSTPALPRSEASAERVTSVQSKSSTGLIHSKTHLSDSSIEDSTERASVSGYDNVYRPEGAAVKDHIAACRQGLLQSTKTSQKAKSVLSRSMSTPVRAASSHSVARHKSSTQLPLQGHTTSATAVPTSSLTAEKEDSLPVQFAQSMGIVRTTDDDNGSLRRPKSSTHDPSRRLPSCATSTSKPAPTVHSLFASPIEASSVSTSIHTSKSTRDTTPQSALASHPHSQSQSHSHPLSREDQAKLDSVVGSKYKTTSGVANPSPSSESLTQSLPTLSGSVFLSQQSGQICVQESSDSSYARVRPQSANVARPAVVSNNNLVLEASKSLAMSSIEANESSTTPVNVLHTELATHPNSRRASSDQSDLKPLRSILKKTSLSSALSAVKCASTLIHSSKRHVVFNLDKNMYISDNESALRCASAHASASSDASASAGASVTRGSGALKAVGVPYGHEPARIGFFS